MNFKHLLLIAGSLLLVVACASKKKSMEMDRSYPTSASPQEPMVGATADMEMADEALPPQQMPNTESYDKIVDNKFLPATSHPLSTFSIDVDTASYANLRRFLTSGVVPPKDAIRIEEMINYFPYDYTHPKGSSPLTVQVDAYSAPWKPEHHLVRVAIKGKELKKEEIKPSNLVFLLDVSGSMETPNKLPLLKRSFRKLVENLDGRDRVSIVAYAGASGVVLPPTKP